MGKFLSVFLYTNKKFISERPLLQGVHSFQTVHWTVWKFTLCGAPKGCIDLRSIWGAAPNPARGAASGLCKRGIAPFETRCYRLRRFGALPHAPSLKSRYYSNCFPRNLAAAVIRLLCRSPASVCFSDVRNATAPETSPPLIIGTAAIAVLSRPSAG